MKRQAIVGLVTLVVLVVAAGIYAQYYSIQQRAPTELRVFVAASLTNAVKDHQQGFEKVNNVKILTNFGGSDQLYQQIYSGSPVDVFMAADSSWLLRLNQNGLLYNGKYWNFTSNILVVVLPPDNPKNIKSLIDLVQPGVRIAVAGFTVPVGRYTNITLTQIEKTWGNSASPKYKGPEWQNYRHRVIANVVTYETTVEQVVGKVLTGTVDAGFAYMSDATFLGQSKLKYVQIPSDVNVQAAYGIGVVKGSANYDLATKYVNFWLSQEGQGWLVKYGFGSTLPSTTTSIENPSASDDSG
jgi:molybdate transport system substrate-binding protein